jgi:hypothetical protein
MAPGDKGGPDGAGLDPVISKFLGELRGMKDRSTVDLKIWKAAVDEADRLEQGQLKLDAPSMEFPFEYFEASWLTNMATATLYMLRKLDMSSEMPGWLDIKVLRRLLKEVNRVEMRVMPMGPPLTSVSRTFFAQWAIFDLVLGTKEERGLLPILCHFFSDSSARKPELAEVAREAPVTHDGDFSWKLNHLGQSRLGVFVVELRRGDLVELREIPTNERFACVMPRVLGGMPGERVLVRVVPVIPEKKTDELPHSPAPYVATHPPYLLMDPDEKGWTRWFRDAIKDTQAWTLLDPGLAHLYLMKRGASPSYWVDYVAYNARGFKGEATYLGGLPDPVIPDGGL